jgi:hypothetical protein
VLPVAAVGKAYVVTEPGPEPGAVFALGFNGASQAAA